VHARRERADQGVSPSTQEEVAVNELLLTRELIAGGGLCRQRRSQWEDHPQGEVAIERRVRHRRINAL